ncbi:MAG: DUF2911 domain-containing protein [Ginsengibacter sp.]
MKKILTTALITAGLIAGNYVSAQNTPPDKSKRPSPPATVTQTISSGATITINYSQPSVKGRTIGKDLEPMDNKVWRTGANEATVFETDKNVMVQGKELAAGKYGLFTIFNGNDVTVIFNKTSEQWGAFNYKESDDALRVNAKSVTAASPSEKLTFKISPDGVVSLLWDKKKVDFSVK